MFRKSVKIRIYVLYKARLATVDPGQSVTPARATKTVNIQCPDELDF